MPGLGPDIVAEMEPWIAFAEGTIRRLIADTPLEALVPVREAAYALVALYLGIELLTHLDGDKARAAALFRVATDAAGVVGALAGLETAEEVRG